MDGVPPSGLGIKNIDEGVDKAMLALYGGIETALDDVTLRDLEKADIALKRLSRSFFPNVKRQAKSALLWRREHLSGERQ